jgi:negative regulator of sigma E activity
MRTTERISEVTVKHNNGQQWIFVYYLQVTPSREEGNLYAIRVDKLSRDGILLEKAETCALTASRTEAMTMVTAFAKGTVPPCVLSEMADEWFMATLPVHTYHRAG